MPERAPRLLTCAGLLATFGLAGTARAELPEPSDISVTYYVTDERGEAVRPMTDKERRMSLNRARCECGQKIGVRIEAQPDFTDPATPLRAFVGTLCATAENAVAGQFLPCGRLADELAPAFEQGVWATFHPAFLTSGVAPGSPTREIADPDVLVGDAHCGPMEGEAGLWMCSPQDNATAGCQGEEFFLGANKAAESGPPTLALDYQPPLLEVYDLTAKTGNGSVELRWEVASSGDIQGFRVLCEEAGSGAVPPGFDFPTPGLTDLPTQTHYYTAGNLCGDGPFSTVESLPREVTDPDTCGNGVVEADEACDDGYDNNPEGLCDEDCQLRVSPSLHALDWRHLCSDHISFSTKSVVIDGLDNGKTYNFVLVPYDLVGNPIAHDRVMTVTPGEDLGLGPDFGCGCVTSPKGHGLFAMSLVTFVLSTLRRRDRRRREDH